MTWPADHPGPRPPGLAPVWAKSPGRSQAAGESLQQHTWAVLVSLAGQRRLHPLLAGAAGEARLWRWAFLAAFLHDWGKAAAGFQLRLRGGAPWGHRHEVLSLAFVPWLVSEPEEQGWVAAAILFHHKEPEAIRTLYGLDPPLGELVAELPPAAVEGLAEWAPAAADWAVALGWHDVAESLLPPSPPHPAALPQNLAALLPAARRLARTGASRLGFALRGLILAADHMASGRAGEPRGLDLPAEEQLLAAWKLSRLYAHQRLLAATRGSAVLIAPTGTGKTEAAVLWAAAQQRQQPTGRLLYLLPYQASLNAMHARLQAVLGDGVALQHGRSLFALYHAQLDQGYSPLEAEAAARRAADLARLGVQPVRVTSPYQLLRIAYRLRGYEALCLDLQDALVVVDEIHAYEPVRAAMIIGLLGHLQRHWGVRLCLMSATVPPPLLQALQEHLGPLPLIQPPPPLLQGISRHTLHLLPGDLTAPEHLREIAAAARAGQSVLVCCNTVGRAQAAHAALAEALGAGATVRLLHSRFAGRDRARKEKELAALIEVGARRGAAVVLVATQVVEVSLNLDFDALYSDPAPLEALLQRAGRVNRTGRLPTAPIHVFREPLGPVYEPELVAAALAVWDSDAQNGRPMHEGQVAAWLGRIYDGERGVRWQARFGKALREFTAGYLDTLLPFAADLDLEEAFYRLFDGVEVLPAGLADEYRACSERAPLSAHDLLVTISYRQWRRLCEQGRVQAGRWPPMVTAAYSAEQGLALR